MAMRVHCVNCEHFQSDVGYELEKMECHAPQNVGNWHSPEDLRLSPDKKNENMDCNWYRGEMGAMELVEKVANELRSMKYGKVA